MEQPVSPTGSTSDVAPQQAPVSSREKSQQSDSALSRQVKEQALLSQMRFTHKQICDRLELWIIRTRKRVSRGVF